MRLVLLAYAKGARPSGSRLSLTFSVLGLQTTTALCWINLRNDNSAKELVGVLRLHASLGRNLRFLS